MQVGFFYTRSLNTGIIEVNHGEQKILVRSQYFRKKIFNFYIVITEHAENYARVRKYYFMQGNL